MKCPDCKKEATKMFSQSLDKIKFETMAKCETIRFGEEHDKKIRQETIQRCIEVIEKVEIEVKIYKKKSVS
jgi:hypothetical protein